MADITIVENKQNKLLKRKEIIAEESGTTVPTKATVREKLAALVNTPADQIVVKQVDSKYGSHKSIITAHAYDTKEDMKKNEGMPYLARNFDEFKKKKSTAVPQGPAPKK